MYRLSLMIVSQRSIRLQRATNESSDVVDILLLVTFYFNPSTRLDNATNFRRFVICLQRATVTQVQSAWPEAASSRPVVYLSYVCVLACRNSCE